MAASRSTSLVLRALLWRATVSMLVAGAAACAPATAVTPVLEPQPVLEAIDLDGASVDQAIAWSAPADARDRRAVATRRVGLGRPVVAAPDATTPTSHDTLAIVSWNAHAGAADVGGLLGALRRGGLTHGVPAANFVLLLQEVTRRQAVRSIDRPDIIRVAADERLHLFYAPSMPNGGERDAAEDRGNGMLSTLPLSQLRAFELPFERQRRVALAATVTVGTFSGSAWVFNLVDVHLENRAGRRRFWLRSAAARNRQAAALLEALPPDDPLVIGGDLNAWSGTDALLRIFRRHGLTASEDDRRPTFGRRGRLDYILARVPAGISVHTRRLDDRYGSDHYPMLACLHW